MGFYSSGYKLLDYLIADRRQYFNTGIYTDETTRIVMDVELISLVNNQANFFGSSGTYKSNGVECLLWNKQINFNVNGQTGVYGIGTANAGDKLHIELNKSTCVITKNDVLFLNKTYANEPQKSSATLQILSIARNGNVSSIKLGRFKLYSDDTLILDYVPCINNEGIAGMYDTVSDTFVRSMGNADFIAGNIIDDVSDFDLITDRTEADVKNAEESNAKGFAQMTASEKSEYLSSLKGAYNASDLNRVGYAMIYLADKFNDYGYSIDKDIKINWRVDDIPNNSDMLAYLNNVKKMKAIIPVTQNTPDAPNSMSNLLYTQANDIEQILLDVDSLLNNIIASLLYSGEIFAGEV